MIFNLMDNARRSKGLELAYTGTMTQSNVTVSGAAYTLYTITTSGTLTVKGGSLQNVDIWCCGGGANGQPGTRGGGGGYFAEETGVTLSTGTYNLTIGAAQGTTSLVKGDESIISANGATDANGGSGGGGGGDSGNATGGTGSGSTTRPFGDSTNFTSLPCAGGGGRCVNYRTYDSNEGGWVSWNGKGGDGGSNGSNGAAGEVNTTGWNSSNAPGAGGATGGGAGATGTTSVSSQSGSPATYYGSGGGASWYGASTGGADKVGSGYQGVMYMRTTQAVTPTPGGTAYKYYRLNMTGMMRDSGAVSYFSVAELALYNGSTAVSYTGATYSASSSLSGYAVGNAFDGSTSTIWHTDGAPESAWIQVQLASASKITSFAITPRTDQNDRLNAFTLQGSNDGSTWTTLYTGTDTASGWAQGATKTFTI